MQRLPMAALLTMAVLCIEHPGWAARGKKSVQKAEQFVSDCAEYSQDKVNDGLKFELNNTCNYAMTCTMSWQVRCAGGRGSPGGRTVQLDLPANGSVSTAASAAACAPNGWSISDVKWHCDKRGGTNGSGGKATGDKATGDGEL